MRRCFHLIRPTTVADSAHRAIVGYDGIDSLLLFSSSFSTTLQASVEVSPRLLYRPPQFCAIRRIILPERVLGRGVGPVQCPVSPAGQSLYAPSCDFAYSSGGRLLLAIKRDVGADRLTFNIVRNTYYGGFGTDAPPAPTQSRRPQTVTGDVQHVVQHARLSSS